MPDESPQLPDVDVKRELVLRPEAWAKGPPCTPLADRATIGEIRELVVGV